MTDATWIGGAPNAPLTWVYGTASNWTGGVPSGTATFENAPQPYVQINSNATVGGWTFAGGTPFNFIVSSGVAVTFNVAGIRDINSNSSVHNIGTAINNDGTILFLNSSSAGSININNSNGYISFIDKSTASNSNITNGYRLYFTDEAKAGMAKITNNAVMNFEKHSTAEDAMITNSGEINFFGSTVTGDSTAGNAKIVNGGELNFKGTATAGNATITNNYSLEFSVESTAGTSKITSSNLVVFLGKATAGNATITLTESSTSIGFLEFLGSSTAGNATIVVSANTNLRFLANADGGNARITNLGPSIDFSGSAGPAGDSHLSAGSIAGTGNFLLGANKQFTVGSNSLSTTLSGRIDGFSNTALIKVGTGTLTLTSVNNNYDGGTTIKGGTLRVDGKIVGDVAVNTGGTLGGNGIVDAVTTYAGGTLTPGSNAGAGRLTTDSVDIPGRIALRRATGWCSPRLRLRPAQRRRFGVAWSAHAERHADRRLPAEHFGASELRADGQ